MDSISLNDYIQTLIQIIREYNLTADEKSFSKPMPWIGLYIAFTSLFCVILMVADLVHGFRTKKLWFPCKYFTLNAASLTVIAVAMKLTVDLNNPMPGEVDQGAKLGSMAFMLTMMANFLPSLAAMDAKQLLTNVLALNILVITLVVNVCIEIKTGVISARYSNSIGGIRYFRAYSSTVHNYNLQYYRLVIATTFTSMLLVLMVIHICTSLTITKSKNIIQSKYQTGHETALNDLEMQQPRTLTVEKLKMHVTAHWIMAGTGSPQFITICSVTTYASGVICVLCTIVHAIVFVYTCQFLYDYHSDYKWSMLVILMIQFIGAIVGTIAPLSRCFAGLNFKVSVKWIWNHIKVFKVESYWTQKLRDWKQSSIPFSVSSRKSKILFEFFKTRSLNFCIGFQWTVVVVCKMIAFVPVFLVICVLYCIRCLKWLKFIFRDSGSGTGLDTTPGENDTSILLSRYVLQHQEDMEVADRTLKNISNSVNKLIKKAEKQQPCNLIKLLEQSSSFEGVGKYDNHHVPSLLTEEPLNCWSLPVVTLTTLAISLANIQKNRVDSLLRSVSEGLAYVTLVEESLNTEDEYGSIQKAAKSLWLEVEVYHKWLGKKLKNPDPKMKTTGQILQWFKNTARNIVNETKSTDISRPNENSVNMCICANSMYRITETILLAYNTDIEEVSQEKLFTELSSMIADILAACLTNLPQVIVMKCHESVIEKREASVHSAAQLLGETTQIINSLQDREIPSLNPIELSFIDKWRAALTHPSP